MCHEDLHRGRLIPFDAAGLPGRPNILVGAMPEQLDEQVDVAALLGSAFDDIWCGSPHSVTDALAREAARQQEERHHNALIMWSLAESRAAKRHAYARSERPFGPSPLQESYTAPPPPPPVDEEPMIATASPFVTRVRSAPLRERDVATMPSSPLLKDAVIVTTAVERPGLAPVRPPPSPRTFTVHRQMAMRSALTTAPAASGNLRCVRPPSCPPSSRARRASRETDWQPMKKAAALACASVGTRAARVRRASRERMGYY